MANLRLPMFQIRRILQLRQQGFSKRAIAQTLAIARNTVEHYLGIVEAHFTDLQQALDWQDEQLHRLFTKPLDPQQDRVGDLYQRFPAFEQQLAQTGVTRTQLWTAYKYDNPNGVQYTQFCQRYKKWRKTQLTTMHLEHKAGDKLFVDFAGERLSIVDPATGQQQEVEVFVAVLGCSQMTYLEGVVSQRKEAFIDALQNAFFFFGGVPQAVVPDNLKAAVQTAHRYEPDLNETLAAMASHYQTCIYPARSRKPRDKSLVERTVGLLYQRVYTTLQGQVFDSLAALNQAIRPLLDAHNQCRFQGKDYSRLERFLTLEAPVLRPLPPTRYQLQSYRVAKVQTNCHVLLLADRHYYSVPHRFVGQRVKLIYTQQTVEIYHQYERIATHSRSTRQHGYTTRMEHLPTNQQWVAQWSPAFFRQQAGPPGEPIYQAIDALLMELEATPGVDTPARYPLAVYRSCAGLLALQRRVGQHRLEQACVRALYYGRVSYKLVRRILDAELDRLPLTSPADSSTIPAHSNIRGASAYQ